MPILAAKAKLLILAIRKINIIMIGTDVYYMTYKLKKSQVFIISIKNQEYQAKIEDRKKTNLIKKEVTYNWHYILGDAQCV